MNKYLKIISIGIKIAKMIILILYMYNDAIIPFLISLELNKLAINVWLFGM